MGQFGGAGHPGADQTGLEAHGQRLRGQGAVGRMRNAAQLLILGGRQVEGAAQFTLS